MNFKVTALQDVNVRGYLVAEKKIAGNGTVFLEEVPVLISVYLKEGQSRYFAGVKDVCPAGFPLDVGNIPHPKEPGGIEVYKDIAQVERIL